MASSRRKDCNVAVGELVWVRTGRGSHEEPAKVLRLGCEYVGNDTKETSQDAVLVQFTVSFHEGVYPRDCIRSFSAKRQVRSSAAASPMTLAPTQPPQQKSRSVVTPSPPASVANVEGAKKKSAKRKPSGSSAPSGKRSKKDGKKKATRATKGSKVVAIPNQFVGRSVCKKFGDEWFRGKVTNFDEDDEEGLYSIKYEDDDEEQMVEVELLEILVEEEDSSDTNEEEDSSSPLAVGPKAKKRSSATESSSPDHLQGQSSPYFKKKQAISRSTKAAPKAKAARTKKPKPVENSSDASLDDNIDNAAQNKSDEDDELDRPYKIARSPTSRATCPRCNECIEKEVLRISYVSSFTTGNRPFVSYYHLNCTVFNEDIKSAKDVGGWRKLKQDEYDLLAERLEESKVELEKEQEELEPDELTQKSFEGEIRPAPKGLSGNLLPFQVEGASWMYHQEVNETVRGGILADEMGMGKTVQTITTILDNRPRLQHSRPGAKHPPSSSDLAERVNEDKLWSMTLDDWKHEMEMNKVDASLQRKAKGKQPAGARAGTLVICPVVALTQWKTEIEKFTEGVALTVGIYHGPKRASETPRDLLRTYDIVLTTYQVLEADFRKMTSPNKVECPNCGKKFKADKLRVHLKYFCGEGAQRTEAQARQVRNSERGRGRGPVPGFRRGQKSKKKAPVKAKAQTKKAIRVKSVEDYDSESQLSEAETTFTPGRPSRSAAKTATKRLAKSKGEWADAVSDGSDSYDESSESSDSSVESEARPKSNPNKRSVSVQFSESSNESSSESDSSEGEESPALRRARQKQQQALAAANSSKGKLKKKPAPKKVASKPAKKGAGKKKKVAKKGSKRFESSDSEESSSEDEVVDPMAGIDMDKLLKEAKEGAQMSVLHSLCWWRIVLDEAHFIKTRNSQTAGAAFSLIGVHRWCLSGTPLQNRVGEFYSLIRFLRIDPMAHYFCRNKTCDCKSLHYRMSEGKCEGCGHGSASHFAHFNKHVLNQIQKHGYSGEGRLAMFKLKDEVLDKCLLRRTKETRAADMNLPPRLVTIRKIRLHPVEEDFYNALYTQTRSSFDDYVADGTLLNNYAHIFDLLMRMRQATDHPYLVVYSKRDEVRNAAGNAIANGSADCDICHEPPTERVSSSCCQAAFCRLCVVDYMSSLLSEQDNAMPCPSCQAPFTIDLQQASTSVVDDATLRTPKEGATSAAMMPSLKELPHVATGSILRRINLAEFATSSKIEALTEELVRMRQTSPGSKAIVFSQFVNMLDLIRWRLHSDPCLSKMGLNARALHGGMDIKARDASLKDFREDKDVRVLLMSLKAGGVALNLTVANHIYLMDPWWNPAAEMQAIDRTHRLGQYRPIRAVRFIADNTVEERILQLQEKKRLVFDGTVGRDAGSLQKLTVDDMRSLFA